MIKLLVVDDSALMRKFLRETFEEQGDFEVILARNGLDALEMLMKDKPDVISLDINMPVMDGLTCLSRIMIENPLPVVMVSSLTEKDAVPTFEALALGAVDYVAKPGGTISLNMEMIKRELVQKIRAAARAKIRRSKNLVARLQSHQKKPIGSSPNSPLQHVPVARTRKSELPGLLLIGASTGGPHTLEDILPGIPADYPYPVALAIHMPGTFTGQFARRLNNLCKLSVVEVTSPIPLEAGHIYVGQGDHDFILARKFKGLLGMSVPSDAARPWHPSVDRLVLSAMECFEPEKITGVLLTGMGFDGAEAMAALHSTGGHTIAESEETAVVFGMPKELIERNGAEIVLAAPKITNQLLKWLN